MHDYEAKVRNLQRHFLLRGNPFRHLIDTAIRWWTWRRAEKTGGFSFREMSKRELREKMAVEFKKNGIRM